MIDTLVSAGVLALAALTVLDMVLAALAVMSGVVVSVSTALYRKRQ